MTGQQGGAVPWPRVTLPVGQKAEEAFGPCARCLEFTLAGLGVTRRNAGALPKFTAAGVPPLIAEFRGKYLRSERGACSPMNRRGRTRPRGLRPRGWFWSCLCPPGRGIPGDHARPNFTGWFGGVVRLCHASWRIFPLLFRAVARPATGPVFRCATQFAFGYWGGGGPLCGALVPPRPTVSARGLSREPAVGTNDAAPVGWGTRQDSRRSLPPVDRGPSPETARR